MHSRCFLLGFSRKYELSFLVKDLPSPVFKSSDRFLLNFSQLLHKLGWNLFVRIKIFECSVCRLLSLNHKCHFKWISNLMTIQCQHFACYSSHRYWLPVISSIHSNSSALPCSSWFYSSWAIICKPIGGSLCPLPLFPSLSVSSTENV